jgi:hypothetical protein
MSFLLFLNLLTSMIVGGWAFQLRLSPPVARRIKMSNSRLPSLRMSSSTATTESKATPLPVAYSMDDIVSLCKRRGIIFQSSEIYNGYAGFYDYGPLGAELKKNVKDQWWKTFVTRREDVVGLDSSIIHNPLTWKSSGTFCDKLLMLC